MVVLSIIGVVAFGIFLYFVTILIDGISQKRYGYRFFDDEAISLCVIGYYFIWGTLFFCPEISSIKSINGDNLNAILLISIGLILLSVNIYINLKSTDFGLGVFFTVVQMLILAVAAFAGIFVLLLAMAFFAETKPVYNINGD